MAQLRAFAMHAQVLHAAAFLRFLGHESALLVAAKGIFRQDRDLREISTRESRAQEVSLSLIGKY